MPSAPVSTAPFAVAQVRATLDDHDELIPLPAVRKRTGLSGSMIYKLIRAGKFPPLVKVERLSLWSARKIQHWIDERIAASERDAAGRS